MSKLIYTKTAKTVKVTTMVKMISGLSNPDRQPENDAWISHESVSTLGAELRVLD